MKKLKLYVWTNYNPDWTDGLAVALAFTQKQAEKLVMLQNNPKDYYKKYPSAIEYQTRLFASATLTVYDPDNTKPFAVCVSGGG